MRWLKVDLSAGENQDVGVGEGDPRRKRFVT